MNYYYLKVLDGPFNDVLAGVVEALKQEGFGVLSRINVHEKFKEKLGVEFRPYVILGACNPKSAKQAIELEDNIGLLLPCNVIVYEKGNQNVVAVIRPTAAMNMIDNDELKRLAAAVEGSLKKVLDNIRL